MENLEKQFYHAMIGVYENAKDHEYFATYFKRMIDQYGGFDAAKRLLAKPGIQEGLMKLWELGCLDQSMEALVIQDRFHALFTNAEIAEAHRRLEELGYKPKE
jgi:5-methylcytosine-specific restriction enzyme A